MSAKPVCGSYIPLSNMTEKKLDKINFHQITHVYLAFSKLEIRRQGVIVPTLTPPRRRNLQMLMAYLKEKGITAKVLLSIGGWGARHFCEASKTEAARRAFAAGCLSLVREFGLDGIDLDWEFPGEANALERVTACKTCRSDFIELCREVRRALGHQLLTCAVGSNKYKGLDCRALAETMDYIHVMTYDMDAGRHSDMLFTAFCMQMWQRHGVPAEKLALGVPFYGRCRNPAYEWLGYDELQEKVRQGSAKLLHTRRQDFVVIGRSRISIDTPASIAKKCAYIKKRGYAGIFCWQEYTDDHGELRRAMFENMCG